MLLPWTSLSLVLLPFALWGLCAWLTLARLRDLPDLPEHGLQEGLPSVTICIPARNEEREVGQALDSWLAQEYPRLSIIVVDDASSDGTPAILAQRAAAHPQTLCVLRNDSLPAGWLGKNHALDLASRQPQALAADWLLFTDADAQAVPTLLKQAFAFLQEHPGDILALMPGVDTVGLAERVFIPMAALAFLWAVPVRRVPLAHSRVHCGVGAFTLVRRQAYDAVNGHAGAPMEVIDDMKLAQRVKAAGYSNRVALAGPHLHLRMYHGLNDLVVGMRKNVLALPGLFPLAPLAAVLVLACSLSPLLLALAGHGWAGFWLWLLVPPVLGEAHQRFSRRPADPAWALWPLIGLPLAAGLLWAFADRLRGVNHWRGREVKLR